MDSAAFMTLPASSFSPMPKETEAVDTEEIAAASSPYTNLNGYLPHTEGERRRKEMLVVATMLEERYRVLLPPDRVRRAPEPVLSESTSRSRVQSRDGDDSETDQASVAGERFRLRLPARSSTSTTPAPSPAAMKATSKKPRPSVSSKQPSVIRVLQPVVPTLYPPPPTLPHAEASPLSPSPTIDMDISSPEPVSSPPSPTVATVLPQTPRYNQASMVEPGSRNVPLSSHYHNGFASGIVSGPQSYPYSKWPFVPFEQEMSVMPSDQEMLMISNEQERSPAPSDQERPIIPDLEKSPTLQDQERPIIDQEMLSTPPEQESLFTPEPERLCTSEPERLATPEPERLGTLEPERLSTPEPERLSTPEPERLSTPESEKLSTPEPERRPASPEPEAFITRDQERLLSPPVPARLPTPLEEEITPGHRRLLTPLVRDKSVTPEQETLAPPLERERSVVPERVLTPPKRERTITPEPERLPTPPVPERLPTPLVPERLPIPLVPERLPIPPVPERVPTPPVPERLPTPPVPERLPTPPVERRTPPLVDMTDQELQDYLPEKDSKSMEPHMAIDGESEKASSEDKMSVRAESEVPVVRDEPEKEEVEAQAESEADRMDVEQDGTVGLIPTEEAVIAAATMDVISDATLAEQTVVPDVPITQEPADSGPTVIEQVEVPVSEVNLHLDRPVTPEQRPHTESVDIQKTSSPSPMPISSISAPRGRGRKKARLDPSIQPTETVSAPVRAPRVPKNHVTYTGASGEVEVTASAIIKAAVHRTQRDVARHLTAFGVPVPNAIATMGPDFELPEWIFPPLSPAESEHALGDFDDIELDPKTLSEEQVTSVQGDDKESIEVNGDGTALDPVTSNYTAESVAQPTRQTEPKNKMSLRLPPRPVPEAYEEDTVSLDDEDT